MQVLQLIDSLDAGGAERVAVNLSNVLASRIDGSFLCATRKEGLLKESISKAVKYLFLNKQKKIDLKAIHTLSVFVKENKINIIHAHSSSFFLAIIIKFLNRNISIIWHDHYGNSEFLENRNYKVLKFCSKYFSHIFSVNKTLETWAKEKLRAKRVDYLSNFATSDNQLSITVLKGVSGKRIVCIANLRAQKDHFTLIDAFKIVVKSYPDWTLHCVGKDFNDVYSENVKLKIKSEGLSKFVYLYESKPDIFNILTQCEIGVLSSKSEGLPIALLEYGLANLAVVSTNVGECKNVIKNRDNGLLVSSLDSIGLSKALVFYIQDEILRTKHSTRYNSYITKHFSEKSQLKFILETYTNSIK